MYLLRPSSIPPSHPLAPGAFPPPEALRRWWKEDDLAPPVPWSEGDLQGWVHPDYTHLSLSNIPWDRVLKENLAQWRVAKFADTRRVIRFQNDPTSECLYIKWVQIRGIKKSIGGIFRFSKAAREFELGRRVLAAGFMVPTPLLVAERRIGRTLRDAYLVTRGIDPGWNAVDAVWKSLQEEDPDAADQLLDDLGRAVRGFHDHGFAFDDSRAQHWFVKTHLDDASRPDTTSTDSIFHRWAVLDLDASQLQCTLSMKRRRYYLAMLLASFSWPLMTHDHMKQILAAYSEPVDKGIVITLPQLLRAAEKLHNKP